MRRSFLCGCVFALQAALGFCGLARAVTIGDPVTQRAFLDRDAGQVYVYAGSTSPFPITGTAQTWSFYDSKVAGGVVTPLLLRILGPGSYEVTGIGTSQLSGAGGVVTSSFGLIAGSDFVEGGGYTFGFTNRAYTVESGQFTAGASSAGVVPYDHPSATIPYDQWYETAQLQTGGPVTVAVGSVFGSGGTAFYVSGAGDRVYSADLTVPEPASTVGLCGFGLGVLSRRRRRWRRGGAGASLARVRAG
jgi:hypothetical protein